MSLTKTTRSTRRTAKRRAPLATAALLGLGLLATGGAYAGLDAATANASAAPQAVTEDAVSRGEALFAANCATCHGMSAVGSEDGPSLIGVGAASVDFQVGTGRMPMQANSPQAPKKPVQFTQAQIDDMAAYISSLAPGPAVPAEEYLDTSKGDAANGAELFRINCAMCHNVAAAGGALTEGKFAPELQTVEPAHLYEAMITGPQNMPVFSDANLTPEDKRDIITAIRYQTEVSGGVAGYGLGSVGPVSEGLFIWIFGIGGSIVMAIWLTSRPN